MKLNIFLFLFSLDLFPVLKIVCVLWPFNYLFLIYFIKSLCTIAINPISIVFWHKHFPICFPLYFNYYFSLYTNFPQIFTWLHLLISLLWFLLLLLNLEDHHPNNDMIFFLINLGFFWWVHKEKNWGNAWTWFGSKRQSGVFPIVIVGELPIKWIHKKYKCQ